MYSLNWSHITAKGFLKINKQLGRQIICFDRCQKPNGPEKKNTAVVYVEFNGGLQYRSTESIMMNSIMILPFFYVGSTSICFL